LELAGCACANGRPNRKASPAKEQKAVKHQKEISLKYFRRMGLK